MASCLHSSGQTRGQTWSLCATVTAQLFVSSKRLRPITVDHHQICLSMLTATELTKSPNQILESGKMGKGGGNGGIWGNWRK